MGGVGGTDSTFERRFHKAELVRMIKKLNVVRVNPYLSARSFK